MGPCRRTSSPRASGRPRISSASFARAGVTHGGRAIPICVTVVAARNPRLLLFKIQLRHPSTRPRHQIQTARHVLISVLLPTRAPRDSVAASGVTVDPQLDIVEIAARVEIVGSRKRTKSSQ